MTANEADLDAARDVLRCGESVQPPRLLEVERANAGGEIESCRAMALVGQRSHTRRRWQQSVGGDEQRCVRRPCALARHDTAKEPQLARRAQANNTADSP